MRLNKTYERLGLCVFIGVVLGLGYIKFTVFEYQNISKLFSNNEESEVSRQVDGSIHKSIQRLCPWPPRNVNDLIEPNTGLYNLALRPKVVKVKLNNVYEVEYPGFLQKIYKENYFGTSWLHFLVKKIKYDRIASKDSYELYPMKIDILKTINSVRWGEPVEKPPINDPSIKVYKYPRNICHQPDQESNLDLVVFIKSCAKCFRNRRHIRRTFMKKKLWDDFRIKFVFVTGMPKNHETEFYHFDGTRLKEHHSINSQNLSYSSALAKLIREADRYNDMLVGMFEDGYFNLTLKMVFNYRWAAAFCQRQSPLFLFMDDDYSIIPVTIKQFISNVSLASRWRYYGGKRAHGFTLRPDQGSFDIERWRVSENEIPWSSYPPFPCGFGYFMGAELVTDVAIAMAFTRFFRIDDAYLGFVMDKLNVQLQQLSSVYYNITQYDEMLNAMIGPQVIVDQCIQWTDGSISTNCSERWANYQPTP